MINEDKKPLVRSAFVKSPNIVGKQFQLRVSSLLLGSRS